mmetsp:Transcript_32672/g.98764  ORF Transcript_32672/g.98764 Transcript_32672/m.98764 type:complete len:301 (-) Transcript_32672:69-971(-)
MATTSSIWSPRKGGPPSCSCTPWIEKLLLRIWPTISFVYMSALMDSNSSVSLRLTASKACTFSWWRGRSSAARRANSSALAFFASAASKAAVLTRSLWRTKGSNQSQKSEKVICGPPSGDRTTPWKSAGSFCLKLPSRFQVSSNRCTYAGMSSTLRELPASRATHSSAISGRRRRRPRRPRSTPAMSPSCRYNGVRWSRTLFGWFRSKYWANHVRGLNGARPPPMRPPPLPNLSTCRDRASRPWRSTGSTDFSIKYKSQSWAPSSAVPSVMAAPFRIILSKNAWSNFKFLKASPLDRDMA